MTLLMRIWNDERLIICSDEQVNNEFGIQKEMKKHACCSLKVQEMVYYFVVA